MLATINGSLWGCQSEPSQLPDMGASQRQIWQVPGNVLLLTPRLVCSLLAQPLWQVNLLATGGTKNIGNSHQSYEPTMHCSGFWMHWSCRYPCSIFRLANDTSTDSSQSQALLHTTLTQSSELMVTQLPLVTENLAGPVKFAPPWK